MIVFYEKDDNAQQMRSCIRYVSLEVISEGDAEGLLLDSRN